tara:strand:+ start:10 stop:792 length:783 start_codon:yes stop_codon:yes gene_type:complete
MSKWKSVLKATSIEKQTSNQAMDKFVEGLGKIMQEYEKEKANQPTTATQPTQPTRARTPYRPNGRPSSPPPPQEVLPPPPISPTTSTQAQKPQIASGYKGLTQQEVDTFKQGGLPDSKIRELDRKRAESVQQQQQLRVGDTRTVSTVGDKARQLGRTLARPIQRQSQLAREDIKAIKDALASVAQDVTREGTRQTRYSKDPLTGQITSQQIERAKRKLPPRLRDALDLTKPAQRGSFRATGGIKPDTGTVTVGPEGAKIE